MQYHAALPSDAIEAEYLGFRFFATPCGQIWRQNPSKGFYKMSQIKQSQTKNNKKYFYGHTYIGLYQKDMKRTTVTVSKLIAIAFIPNPLNLPIVMHKDETLNANGLLDNSASNLMWGTRAENVQDRVNKKRCGSGGKKLNKEIALAMRKMHCEGKKVKEIAAIYSVGLPCVYDVIKRATWRNV